MRIGILKTKFLLTLATSLISICAFAQGEATQGSNGFVTAITTANSEISNVFSVLADLMLAVGGIVGVVGAIRIYIKWNNGDQDVTKAIVGWGGACLFLLLSGGVISAVFNIR